MSLSPCPACGAPISAQAPACPRCGQPTPNAAAQKTKKTNTVLFALMLLAGVGYVVWREHTSSVEFAAKKADERKQQDAEFCRKNLDYYTGFCKTWPDNCKEGPRKLARCD